jgi:hypothetical protein
MYHLQLWCKMCRGGPGGGGSPPRNFLGVLGVIWGLFTTILARFWLGKGGVLRGQMDLAGPSGASGALYLAVSRCISWVYII